MNLNKLTTEQINNVSKNLDEMDTLSIVNVINNEDKKVPEAIEKEAPQIAKAIDAMSTRFLKGGRIIYIGAGTSGRLGVLDAIELTPTYNVPDTLAFGIMAGGKEAMYHAIEGAEDSTLLGKKDLENVNLTTEDIVIGITASGRTPYTIAALEYANEVGALTISVSCNNESPIHKIAHIPIAPIVGPEIVTGSTRMKAGTAQKLVLNTLSTGTMVRTGKVYGNLMVNVQSTNKKLAQRSINILKEITNLSEDEANTLFIEGEENISISIVMHQTGKNKDECKKALNQNNFIVKKAVEALNN